MGAGRRGERSAGQIGDGIGERDLVLRAVRLEGAARRNEGGLVAVDLERAIQSLAVAVGDAVDGLQGTYEHAPCRHRCRVDGLGERDANGRIRPRRTEVALGHDAGHRGRRAVADDRVARGYERDRAL